MDKKILIYTLLSVAASALNYLIYPILSRILPNPEYIDITVALSLFTQIATFLSSIVAITIGLSKLEDQVRANREIEVLQAFIFKLFFLLAIAFFLLAPLLMNAIDTPVLYAIPITLMLISTVPVQILSGYLNGKSLLIQVGFVSLLGAGLQFTLGFVGALTTHNGAAVLSLFVIAQILTIVALYTTLSKYKLPSLIRSLRSPLSYIRRQNLTSLFIYTTVAAIAIAAVNLVQVADLLTLQRTAGEQSKFYTDIYIISRAVFFAGTIFIWPFLGKINLNNYSFNRKPFLKTISIFIVIAIAAILTLVLFGGQVVQLLFGETYQLSMVVHIGALSIMFKVFMLIITAGVLYFTVLRSYKAALIAGIASVATYVTSLCADSANMSVFLITINLVSGAFAAFTILLVLFTRTTKRL